jgi:hypothetical protein
MVVVPGLWSGLSGRAKGPCVNTGKTGLREHYRQLRSSHLWLDVAMCWTVVVPDSGQAFPLDELAARLSGDAPHQLREPALPDALGLPYVTDNPVFVD